MIRSRKIINLSRSRNEWERMKEAMLFICAVHSAALEIFLTFNLFSAPLLTQIIPDWLLVRLWPSRGSHRVAFEFYLSLSALVFVIISVWFTFCVHPDWVLIWRDLPPLYRTSEKRFGDKTSSRDENKIEHRHQVWRREGSPARERFALGWNGLTKPFRLLSTEFPWRDADSQSVSNPLWESTSLFIERRST